MIHSPVECAFVFFRHSERREKDLFHLILSNRKMRNVFLCLSLFFLSLLFSPTDADCSSGGWVVSDDSMAVPINVCSYDGNYDHKSESMIYYSTRWQCSYYYNLECLEWPSNIKNCEGLHTHTHTTTHNTQHTTHNIQHTIQHTTYNTHHTTHNTQHTTHNTQHNTQHTTHNTQHTTHNTQHTTHNTQHTTHNTQHTTHNTQHTTHNTQHTTHNTHTNTNTKYKHHKPLAQHKTHNNLSLSLSLFLQVPQTLQFFMQTIQTTVPLGTQETPPQNLVLCHGFRQLILILLVNMRYLSLKITLSPMLVGMKRF